MQMTLPERLGYNAVGRDSRIVVECPTAQPLSVLQRRQVTSQLVKAHDWQHLVRSHMGTGGDLCRHLGKPQIVVFVDSHAVECRYESLDTRSECGVAARFKITHEAVKRAALREHVVRTFLVGIPDDILVIQESHHETSDVT